MIILSVGQKISTISLLLRLVLNIHRQMIGLPMILPIICEVVAAGKVIPGTRQTDPNYDGVNVYGDETSVDVRQFVGAIGQMYPPGSPQQDAILQLYSSMTNPTMFQEQVIMKKMLLIQKQKI